VRRTTRRLRFTAFVLAGLAFAATLAFFVSPQASSEPDGLNRVAMDKGFAEQESNHALDDTPTAGYEVRGVDDDRLSTGLAGLIGVGVTFALAGGLFLVVRRTGRRRQASPDDGSPG
jgi:cobalt/nickel transport protein